MAIIGKIREKSWLLLIVIGGAIITFIFTSQGPGGSSGLEEQYGIGTVYGEKVDRDVFNEKVAITQENAQRQKNQQLMQQGRQPGSELADPVDRSLVWQGYTESLVLQKEYEALGIEVGDDEFDAFLFGDEGFTVLPDLAQSFQDSATNSFDRNLLQQRIDEMETSEDPEIKKQWDQSKEYYTDLRQNQKYIDIIKQGVYVTDLEAKDNYYAQKTKKNISFISKSYGEINNDDIKVTDAKLKAFFEKHKGERKYQNSTSSREIRFADLQIQPSKNDSVSFDKEVMALKSKFEKTTKDSLFVITYSEVPYYISQVGYRAAKDQDQNKKQFSYPDELDTVFKAAQIGDVIGPYSENGSKKIAKVIGKKETFLSARHILIAAQRADTVAVEKARATTDSIMRFITTSNFEEFVTKYSKDPGSIENGGKYEDFLEGDMVPEFSTFAMEEPIGKIGYVQTDYGFHIMEALERKPANVPNLAIVQKTLKPSPETLQMTEDQAYQLLESLYNKVERAKGLSNKTAMFDTLVKKAGSVTRKIAILDDNPKLDGGGFTSEFAEAELFKLAFAPEAKAGDIISSPIRDGERWVVAILSAIKVKDEATFEDAKEVVKAEYIKDAKFTRLKNQLKGKTLENTQAAKQGTIQKAEVIFGSAQLNRSFSYEPAVIGALFSGLKDGKMTAPIKGEQGVFVVRIDKTTPASDAKNYDEEKAQLTGTLRGGMSGKISKALVKQANVIDNRKFYEIGIRR